MPISIPNRAAHEKAIFPELRKLVLVISIASVIPAVVAIPNAIPCTKQSSNSCVISLTKPYPTVAATIVAKEKAQTYFRLYASTRYA